MGPPGHRPPDLGRDRLGGPEIDDRDGRTLAGEPEAGRAADACSSAGHDRHPPREPHSRSSRRNGPMPRGTRLAL
jgi:hypothetical protein